MTQTTAKNTTHQIVSLLTTVLRQNYFSFHGQIYQPDKGVAMGSPISGTMAEIFLQQMENSVIKHLTDTRILSFCTRYVDDILHIYESTLTNPDNIQQYINTIHNNITLSPTMESANTINFLDLSLTRKPTHLIIGIFRKPTSTDTTINFLSNHPLEHKMAAYRYLIHRLYTLPLCKEQQDREWQFITHMAHSNNIPQTFLSRLRRRIQQHNARSKAPAPPPPPTTTTTRNTKWTTFTYTSPQIKKITKLFKHTNVRVAYKCTNTISHLFKPTNKAICPSSPYDRSGIYKLTCMTCNRSYVGQTSRSLRQRYKGYNHL